MLEWFEIFRTGEHTDSSGSKRNWTESDLDNIVSSYNPANHEAPIVIGHPETNAPAYGWIEKLKRAGNILLAYPRSVIQEFADAVKQGLFKKRSISLYPDGSLRHVGFLGAMPPAVKGLKDIQFSSEETSTAIEFDIESPEPYLSAVAECEAYRSAVPIVPNVPIVPQTETVTETDTVTDTATSLEHRFAESERLRQSAEQKIRQLESKLRFTEFSSFLKDKTSQGNITPAQSELILKIAEASSGSFSENTSGTLSLIRQFVDTLNPRFTLGEVATNKQDAKPAFSKSPAQIIAEEISRNTKN